MRTLTLSLSLKKGQGKRDRMDNLVKIAARSLRNNQTGSEKIFWNAVRQRKIMDLRFMRQHPVTFLYDNRERFFIADFYCAKKRLVVEIDGGIHEKQKDYDELREYIIKTLGYKMIRFTNDLTRSISK